MTIGEARRTAVSRLSEAGVPDAGYDADVLLEWAAGFGRAQMLAYPGESLDPESERRFADAVERRRIREPLQYITGAQEFMGLEIRTDRRALIPRQDTEVLAQEAVLWAKSRVETSGRSDVLDLCTGTGCILLAVLSLCEGASGIGTDVSGDALALARGNEERLRTGASFIESDLFENVSGTYDLIVSNPPYIKSGEIAGLMEEVRLYEPLPALDGHEDGLYFYRKIVKDAPRFLEKGGCLMLEIGYDQAREVCALMEKAGFKDIKIVRDLAGHERVVEGVYV